MWVAARPLLLVACVLASENITVVRKTVSLGEESQLLVDYSLEYILLFTVPEGAVKPDAIRLHVTSEGGDVARPLLITVRQPFGATTWQIPYYSGEQLLYQLERTLCPTDAADDTQTSDCADGENGSAGEFTLHVGTSCTHSFLVKVMADPVPDWRLFMGQDTAVQVTPWSPRVHLYQFAEGQDSVRLIIESEDDICALIAVQNYTCPIAETVTEIEASTLRMTVQKSGGAQISKSRYPRGFLVTAVVWDSDAACSGAEADAQTWLWDSLWRDTHTDEQKPTRLKHITITMKSSLSRAQYALGSIVILVIFLAFYLAFLVLVVAERWPCWGRLVEPKAVLASTIGSIGPAELESVTDFASPSRRRRRTSTATFDSSDNSDTDSDEDDTARQENATNTASTPRQTADTSVALNDRSNADRGNNGQISVIEAGIVNQGWQGTELTEQPTRNSVQSRPFGLPARLHVAALARRRSRVLRARSDRYLYTLYTVAVFYALPVVQFVAAFQLILNVSGSLDLCYYNFLCAHPVGALTDFNHVYSNIGYLLLGALFMVQLRRRQMRRKREPRSEEYGIPPHYGLLSSLGAGMMVVALLSASYHVCPNRLNFQFDTAFMYVLAALSMVKIYQSRHPDINARAHATFAVLAILIAIVVWGVLGGGPIFWSIFTVLHIFTFLLLSLQIYYVGQFRLEKESIAETARSFRRSVVRPLYAPRMIALLVANGVNWAFAIYGLITQASDIASHLLNVLLCNTLLYIAFYICMKLLNGERPRWYFWVYLAGATAAWIPALYFFTFGSTSWSQTPAQSREINHECMLLNFYDSHDLWHMLSAIALYFTFNVMLTWDDGLAAVKREEIAVF